MKETLKTLKRGTVVLSLVLTVLGLLFLLAPDTSQLIICYITGGTLTAFGLYCVIGYFVQSGLLSFGTFRLAQGVALLLVGISVLVEPAWLMGLLGSVFGLVLIVDGVVKLQHAFSLLRIGAVRWWIVLLVAVAVMAAGFVVFFDPFTATRVMMMFAGAWLIADGVADLITVLYIAGSVPQGEGIEVRAEEPDEPGSAE